MVSIPGFSYIIIRAIHRGEKLLFFENMCDFILKCTARIEQFLYVLDLFLRYPNSNLSRLEQNLFFVYLLNTI